MIRVLEIRSDGTAVVSTRGLRRVVLQPGGEIVEELITPREAEVYVRTYNGPGDPRKLRLRAKVVTYGEAFRRGA